MVGASLFTGLSGLRAHQTFLEVVGNNLANANTPGFWAARTSFSETLSMTLRGGSGPGNQLGGTNPMQVGLGARAAGVDADTRQGPLVDTHRPFDLALYGRGFFSLTDGSRSYYTRVGTFGVDAGRNLVDLRTGLQVQNQTGGPMQVPASGTMPGSASTSITFQGILPAKAKGPVAGVLASKTAFKEGTPAVKEGTLSFPADLSALDGASFTVTVDGKTKQTVAINAASFGGDLSAVGFDALKAGIESQATGVAVSQTAAGFRLATTTLGAGATLKLDNAAGTPLAALGLDAIQASGTETAATAATELNSLVGNSRDYVSGDRIQASGTDRDGSPVAGTFTYGADGTTLGDLVAFLDGLFPEASAALAPEGALQLTAAQTGPSSLSLALEDDSSATGRTSFPAFGTTVEGRGPDTVDTSIRVFDAQGIARLLNLRFTRVQGATWNLTAQGGEDGITVVGSPPVEISFNADGSLGAVGGPASLTLTFEGGASQSVALELGTAGGFDGLSTSGEKATAAAVDQDGFAAGEMVETAFDSMGRLLAFYSNGQNQVLDRLRLALFANPAGLQRAGETLLVVSPNSGEAILAAAGEDGAGQVVPGMLEASNVDMAEQFVKLIEAQRGFQASARVVSASDEILAEALALLR